MRSSWPVSGLSDRRGREGPGGAAREASGGAQAVKTRPARVAPALKKAGHVDVRRRVLNGPATTALVLGLCLFTGQGYPGVLARVWPPLGAFNPAMWASPTITSSALSQARTRLPVAVLPKLFAVPAKAVLVEVAGRRVVGLVVTAADGTVMDLADTAEIRERCATPSGSRFPQARIVTLVACGTRRVLGSRRLVRTE